VSRRNPVPRRFKPPDNPKARRRYLKRQGKSALQAEAEARAAKQRGKQRRKREKAAKLKAAKETDETLETPTRPPVSQ
jgi:hypothetical protein